MDIEIEQARLLSALGLAQTVAGQRNANNQPMLSNVVLRATKDNRLVCNATDLMISVSERVPAEVKAPGSLTLGVRSLHNIVRTLPNKPLRLRAHGNNGAELSVGRSSFKLHGLDGADFPALPEPKGATSSKVPAHVFADLLTRTMFSVSTDEARVNLNGVLFECDGATGTMVSTDGHRLTKYSAPFAGPKLRPGIIIPRKGIVELRRVLERQGGDVGLAVDPQHIFVTTDELTLSVKLNNVTFPPYDKVIPTEHTRTVLVKRSELIDVLRRAVVMAPEKTSTVRVSLRRGELDITADNPDLGVSQQSIEVDYRGDEFTAGFNARYLLDVLEAMDCAEARLEYKGELDPCVVAPVGGADYLGVVMPMRI